MIGIRTTQETKTMLQAAAKAEGKSLSAFLRDCARTAAAQVGDAQPEYLYVPETRTLSRYEKVVAATIERCAQVAEEYVKVCQALPGSGIDSVCKGVAAAIRALATEGR